MRNFLPRLALWVFCLGIIAPPWHGCDIPQSVEAAPVYETQTGPYRARRPNFTSPGGVELYDTATNSWSGVSPADVLSIGAAQLNDSPTKPARNLWSTSFNRTLNVGPMGTFSLKNGTKWRTVANTTTTTFDVSVASPTCPGCVALTTYGRYYVYVYDKATLPAAAAMAFEVSTTAPDDNLFYKTGDKTRLYVGTFRENPGTIEKFTARNGVYSYSNPILVAAPVSSPLTYTSLALSATPPFTNGEHAIPAHANQVLIRYDWKADATTDAFKMSNDCSNDTFVRISGLTINERNTTVLPLLIGTNPCYMVSTFGMTTAVYLYVVGFTE